MSVALGPQASSGGAGIDGSWYVDVTDFAEHTHWLNSTASAWTAYGLIVFALLGLAAWWRARFVGPAAMAAVVGAGISTVAAAVINEVVKSFVAEERPCRAIPHVFTVQACPGATDYSFPSNHAVIAAAATVGLLLAGRYLRRLWIPVVAVVATLLMAFSRIYVGAHYPHDVIAGLILGALVALIGYLVLLRVLTAAVVWLCGTPLRPLLAASPGVHDPAPSSHRAPT